MVGQRFGARVVLQETGGVRGEHRAQVACDCGDVAWVLAADLRAGRSHSCRACMMKRRKSMKRKRVMAGLKHVVRVVTPVKITSDKRSYPLDAVHQLASGELWRVVGSWPGDLYDLESMGDRSVVVMGVPSRNVERVEVALSELDN